MPSERNDDAPLRIALYSPNLPESGVSNGIVTYSRVMRDALRSLGHSVVIVTPEHMENVNGSVRRLPPRNPVSARMRRLFEMRFPDDGSNPWVRLHVLDSFRQARQAGAQVFEIEESFGWAGRIAGQGVAIVERLHGPHVFVREWLESNEEKGRGDLREAAEVRSFAKAQAVTAPTQQLLDAISARYGLTLPATRAIPNPMPVAAKADRWWIDRARSEQILFVGRFDLLKGADVAVRAFARALEHRPSLEMVMVGPDWGFSSPAGGKVHFADFVAKEVSPEAQSRIRFLGAVSPKEVTKLRLQSVLSLVTSRFENFPYSVAEAMAVGMPVLAARTFGPSEMIRDRIDGRLVPIGDIACTADAILEMVGNSDLLTAMGQAAYDRATDILSPERIARETAAVYRDAIASFRAR